ncbi:MAG: hypothetical protein M1816_003848 [Peltula sp. TS41687]|nr:MAG: hypothetical protein M1816_003848 [Peltula sp. TS41687]
MRLHNLLAAMVVSAGLVDVTIAQRRTARRQAGGGVSSTADAKGSAKDSATAVTALASATLSAAEGATATDNSASASATVTDEAAANEGNNAAANGDARDGNTANANNNNDNTGNNAVNENVNADAKNNNQNNNNANNNGGAAADGTILDPKAVQEGSQQDGQAGAGDPGQTRSLTDKANFINFCVTQSSFNGALTNGKQVKSGSCNGIVMGDIPAFTQDTVVSSIMINPKPGDVIEADKTFDIQIKMSGMDTGSFTNPANTYYAAPQTLKGGKVVGHSHITCQNLGDSLAPDEPLDATTFTFFKGLNTAANAQGILSATVPKGLPAGNYRCCTMASSSNHQPVLMAVAQRGAQDDCTKFTASKNGAEAGNGGANGGANGGNNGGAQQGGNNNNNNDAGNTGGAAGGGTGGNTGGAQQGGNNNNNDAGNTGGGAGGPTGGNTGGAQQGGNSNNNDAGNTGGATGGAAGGNTGGDQQAGTNGGNTGGKTGGDQQTGTNGGQANGGIDTSRTRRKGLRRPTRPDSKIGPEGTETSTAAPQATSIVLAQGVNETSTAIPQTTGIPSAQGINATDTVTAERIGRRRNGFSARFAARDFVV